MLLFHGLKGVGITAFAAIVLITSSLSVPPIAAQFQEDGPHCYSTPPSNYDALWCGYERQVMNYPRCVEIWTGYNEMLKGYTFDTSKLVRDVAKDCQLPPPPAHAPPGCESNRQTLDMHLKLSSAVDPESIKILRDALDSDSCEPSLTDPKSETPITGCESYTGSQYNDCIDSQLDESLKGVKDPCGDASSPKYVKCLLGNKPYTPKIPRAHQGPINPPAPAYPYLPEEDESPQWRIGGAPPYSEWESAMKKGEEPEEPAWVCKVFGEWIDSCRPGWEPGKVKAQPYHKTLCSNFKSLFPAFCVSP